MRIIPTLNVFCISLVQETSEAFHKGCNLFCNKTSLCNIIRLFGVASTPIPVRGGTLPVGGVGAGGPAAILKRGCHYSYLELCCELRLRTAQ